MGEIGLAGGGIVGSGLADKHTHDFTEKSREKPKLLKYYGTTKRFLMLPK
jgi:hypothetical protein